MFWSALPGLKLPYAALVRLGSGGPSLTTKSALPLSRKSWNVASQGLLVDTSKEK